jgi:hypothetical protein
MDDVVLGGQIVKTGLLDPAYEGPKAFRFATDISHQDFGTELERLLSRVDSSVHVGPFDLVYNPSIAL